MKGEIKYYKGESEFIIKRRRDEEKERFISDYREYLEGFYEEYYSDSRLDWVHRHFD